MRGGARPGAGRKKGARNKMGCDVCELAQLHTPAAIAVLADVMNDDEAPAAARVAAASALLDRAHDKAPQATAWRNRTPDEQRHGVELAANARPAGGAHVVDDILAKVLDDMTVVDALPLDLSDVDDIPL